MSNKSARKKILSLLLERAPEPILIREIATASGIHDWPRRIRELVADGWDIEHIHSPKSYRLRSKERQRARRQRSPINAKQRYRILHRDHSTCRRCGRTIEDGVKLVVDHILPRDWGGSNEDTNLWTLCEECNAGKKAWESDVDAEAMKRVLKQESGRARLREYLKLRSNQVVTKEELHIVARITDYQRRIRELRKEEGLRILSHLEDPLLRPGDYRYEP